MSTKIKYMTTAQIREDFLEFFQSKGCKRYPSSSLIPEDPSLLLANAGMNQFKEYYQGLKTMHEVGACSCQKCLRTNDIDNIGDSRHLSFFEMLGNFAFGGFTKEQAIEAAVEFCTKPEHLGLPMDRLYFTVFRDDDESIELWQKYGAESSHITRLGEEDNFWAAGPTGPCGPCSEIYFDQGEEFGCGEPTCAPGCDCDRYLEFWNLVFTQYDRQEDGSMPDLPHKNIDTGMGLERIAAIMQGQHSNYEGDVLRSLLGVGERLSGKSYGGTPTGADRSLRIIADHSRAVTFMIGDGILPSNEGRGYILRRLLRRAVYHGRLLGIDGAFLTQYAAEVRSIMGDVYPALTENAALIDGIISAEEERFNATLDKGEALLEAELDALAEGADLSGEVAFTLHDTYGFPIDLTREIC
ncbi:MAG: alanine--tRNA ligase, partial [Atopobiaceae bacterium]|nr:alanine--tRNA ligase [Atopobiaceae bacterium]